MVLGYIQDTVQELRERFPGYSMRDLCDQLGILFLKTPLGGHPEACKGFFITMDSVDVITVNSDLPDELQRVILAHELGHAVLHRDLVTSACFHDFSLFTDTDNMEYEANLFAAEYLLSDEEVLSALNEYSSFFLAASALKVPPEMLDFKFRAMRANGYKIEPPLYASGDFLRNMEL